MRKLIIPFEKNIHNLVGKSQRRNRSRT